MILICLFKILLQEGKIKEKISKILKMYMNEERNNLVINEINKM